MRLRVAGCAAPGSPQVGPITVMGSGRQQVVRLGPTNINKPRLMVALRLPGPLGCSGGVNGLRGPVSVAAQVRDPVFAGPGLVLQSLFGLIQEGVVRIEVCHLRLPLFHFLAVNLKFQAEKCKKELISQKFKKFKMRGLRLIESIKTKKKKQLSTSPGVYMEVWGGG